MNTVTQVADNLKRRWFLLLVLSVVIGNFFAVRLYSSSVSIQVPEWPVAVDLLVLLPVAYLLIFRPPFRKALVALLALLLLGILVGSVLVPDESKVLWRQLDDIRWIYLVALICSQAALIGLVLVDIAKARNSTNLEQAVHDAIERRTGSGGVSELLKADARVWLYLFVRKPQRLQFDGMPFYARDFDSNASSMQAFLILVALEVPIAHVIIHLFSPAVAVVVTSLSLYGLVFLCADYRATLLRPTTFGSTQLHIRHGVLGSLTLNYRDIERVAQATGRPRRAVRRMRFVGMGNANTLIVLRDGATPLALLGAKELKEIYIGIDDAGRFQEQLKARLRA